MTAHDIRRPGLAIAVLATLVPASAFAVPNYVEDFNTTTYRGGATSADWNTTTGKLQVPAFQPSLLGTLDTPADAYAVAINDGIAYVADQASGLRIVNVTNPGSPTPVGSFDTPGLASGVAVSGTIAYVADGAAGLQIFSVSNPASPTLLGTFNTPGSGSAVVVVGTLAYVADGTTGLTIVNVSNPASPTLVGIYNTPGSATGVAVSGTVAYVADQGTGLQIVNVSSPTSPTLLGAYDTPGSALGVAIAGRRAYVADGSAGLQILDVGNPASPVLLGTLDTPGSANGVAVVGPFAFVADFATGLLTIDVRVPASPALVTTLDTPGSARAVATAGISAYVADGTSGLQVIRAGAWGPSILGTAALPDVAYALTVSGSTAYVCCAGAGLRIMDIADPVNPVTLGGIDTPGLALDVALSGTTAYVADEQSGLRIIDVSNPASPVQLGVYNTPGLAYGVAVVGTIAYVADEAAGLQIINVSNPASPSLLGTYNTPGSAVDVAVVGSFAYVADYLNGLQIINVSNPASPTLAGTRDTPGLARSVAVVGTTACVADGSPGLQVIDVSVPASPVIVGTASAAAAAVTVAMSGNTAYVGGSGVTMVNVANPASPVELAPRLSTVGNSVATAGPLIAHGNGYSGLMMLDPTERRLEPAGNLGVGIVPVAGTVTRARIVSSIQSGSVSWSLRTSGAEISAGIGEWVRMDEAATGLSWQARLNWTGAGICEVSRVEFEWLYDTALFAALTDIGNDQGGWLRLAFERSGQDFADDPLPVTGYQIHHRVDDAALVARVRSDGAPFAAAELGASGVRRLDDRMFVLGGRQTGGVIPPGVWEVVGWVAATQSDQYAIRVPTSGDSSATGTHWSAYFITTHTTTPSTWYASAVDSGFSVDNLAPNVPTGFAAAFHAGVGYDLHWNPAPESDFRYFKVYRGAVPGFTPGPGNLVHSTTAVAWTDPNLAGAAYYKLTAVDFAGNESVPASASATVDVVAAIAPARFALERPVPNPCRDVAVVRYDVPAAGGRVFLGVYDVGGRLVRALVDRPELAGEHRAEWDGHDAGGHLVPAGIYLCLMRAPGFEGVQKVIRAP